MDFKKATDALFDRVGHHDLAKALGVSVATIRQARLQRKASAHRTPPNHWENAVLKLAEERIGRYQKLIERIRANGQTIEI